jgi:hypothetical protein
MRNTPDNQSVCAYSGYCTGEVEERKRGKGLASQKENKEWTEKRRKKHKQDRLSHLT